MYISETEFTDKNFYTIEKLQKKIQCYSIKTEIKYTPKEITIFVYNPD
jgi:hypothetical protein